MRPAGLPACLLTSPDLFHTSHDNPAISETSSYLDLAPLYGSSDEDLSKLRTFKDGKIKPDCFMEKRLLGFPPGVSCLLIMFNRCVGRLAKARRSADALSASTIMLPSSSR